ncbi:MAG TPA: spore coat protein U domain-containing protein [Usitatibacter sp.]|nr:spore coat protein U domain-containing protein [Usitatibacter sp.]
MKKILLPLVAASSILAAASAHAVTTPAQGFNVTVTLTSACTVSAPAAVAFTYTSGQVGAATATGGGFNVTCTNNLPYTIALDAAGGTFAAVNLAYTLSLSAAAGTGNGVAQPFTVNGSIAGSQSGTCGSASCNDTSARTLTVSY